MRRYWLALGMLVGGAAPLGAAPLPVASTAPVPALARASHLMQAHRPRAAVEALSAVVQKPDFKKLATAPQALLMLGEAAEAYLKDVNARYWKRSRLDPKSPSWLSYLRTEQRWASRHYATFTYYDPGQRYRYEGDAYRMLVAGFPRHKLAEEAAWRLIPKEDDGEHDTSVDPALVDASRHERFLRQYPKSPHRLEARVAIGWDYLYASGFTWGKPLPRRFEKGERILQAIVKEAPASPQAAKARALLARAKNPFGYIPTPSKTPAKGS